MRESGRVKVIPWWVLSNLFVLSFTSFCRHFLLCSTGSILLCVQFHHLFLLTLLFSDYLFVFILSKASTLSLSIRPLQPPGVSAWHSQAVSCSKLCRFRSWISPCSDSTDPNPAFNASTGVRCVCSMDSLRPFIPQRVKLGLGTNSSSFRPEGIRLKGMEWSCGWMRSGWWSITMAVFRMSDGSNTVCMFIVYVIEAYLPEGRPWKAVRVAASRRAVAKRSKIGLLVNGEGTGRRGFVVVSVVPLPRERKGMRWFVEACRVSWSVQTNGLHGLRGARSTAGAIVAVWSGEVGGGVTGKQVSSLLLVGHGAGHTWWQSVVGMVGRWLRAGGRKEGRRQVPRLTIDPE